MNKKILKRKIDFIKTPFLNYLLKNNHRRVNQYAKYYDKLQIRKNTILYESRDGNSMTDSPYAMFKYMLENPEYRDYQHIWSIADFEKIGPSYQKYKDHPNVKFVIRNSKQYLKYLASCEFLINNSTFQSFYIPKKDQKYINTWHGTPLKSMGFDIPGNPSSSQNVVRNFLSADFILSPNEHTTKIFTDSYKLNGVYEGTIIEEGYPRIDLTLNTNPDEFKDYLRGLDLCLNQNKESILYAPTWKGTNVSKANNDVLQILADINYLESQVGHKYNIFIKVHPFLYAEAAQNHNLKSRLIPDFVDTNELLSMIDLLITDYSSIFFDFLVTNKPIIFYTWDSDVYSEQRGQYIDNKDLPGPILYNSFELAESITNIDSIKGEYKSNYKKMQNKFTNYEDGRVTERVVNHVFGSGEKKLKLISNLSTDKEKILIYPGGMMNNGITSSFINLMNNIDYQKFDVSCFTATPHAKEVLNNMDKVNKNVRFLFKPGLPVYKLFDVYRDKFIHNRGKQGFLGGFIFPKKAYVREHTRLFGNSKFDYVIDFSGYSLFWAKYLIVADAKKKICFMHNDLLSDSERTINGKRPHRINLRGLFSIYSLFDKLVSVSKGTMELNRKNLIEYADYEKFDYVMNSINPEKILGLTNDEMETLGLDNLKTEHLKSRAKLVNVDKYPVWSALPNQMGSTKFGLNKKLKDTEILIFRKANYNNDTFYKFSVNYQVYGWINSKAVKLIPDSIIEEKEINAIAELVKPRGNHIWTMPYKVAGIKKVSNSLDYKNIIFDIDKEVQTQHGTYSKISINNVVIGWIDKSALKILEHCTISESTSISDQSKINQIREKVKSNNYQGKANVIDNIENRILEEKNISYRMYARINKPDNHSVWTKPYPNFDAKKVDSAKSFEGQIAKINTICKTRIGTYYEFLIDDQSIGWLDCRAFEMIEGPAVIKERIVSLVAELSLGEKDAIWTKPYGLNDAKKVLKNAKLNGEIVTIDKEVTTQKSTYMHILKDGVPLGWLDKSALKIKQLLGTVVENRFIPDPINENINFVNMGRLSPEKGQDNLIRAFAEFHKKHNKSKLYILGQGPLKEYLQEIINEVGMNDSVYLMGQLENPFTFMKKCDCFVLSSHYEGQPMVLLEAMTLGMKIIATDIVANRTVLEDGKYGLLVENSINGLEKGLLTLVNKDDSFEVAQFNYRKYNNTALKSFYSCLS